MNRSKVVNFFCVVIFLVLIPLTIFAHAGGLDENGGHYDKATGEYHYHNKENSKSDNTTNNSKENLTDLEAIPKIKDIDKDGNKINEDENNNETDDSAQEEESAKDIVIKEKNNNEASNIAQIILYACLIISIIAAIIYKYIKQNNKNS